jgi:DNA-binding transcriptional LysR family regulator
LDTEQVLREMVTMEQIEALASNRIDLGMVRMPIDRRGLRVLCVHREPLLVAVLQNHPLATGRDPQRQRPGPTAVHHVLTK